MPTRVVQIDPTPVGLLGPHEPVRRWRDRLLNAGMLCDVRGGPFDDDAPHAWLVALQQLLFDASQLEEDVTSARAGPGRVRWSLPAPAWPVVIAIPLILLMIAFIPDDFTDRLRLLGASYATIGLLACAALVWTGLVERQRRHQHAVQAADLERALKQARADLQAGARALIARPFRAHNGTELIVCLPDAAWLRQEALALRERARRHGGDAAFAAEAEHAAAALVTRATQDDFGDRLWTEDGATIDRAPWIAGFAAAQAAATTRKAASADQHMTLEDAIADT